MAIVAQDLSASCYAGYPFSSAPNWPLVGPAGANSDTDELTYVSRKVKVETTGQVHVKWASGDDDVLTLDPGWHDIRVRQIYVSGTTVACKAYA